MAGRSAPGSGSASSGLPFLALVRPANGLIAGAAVAVGALVARRPPAAGPVLLGALAAFAAAAGANALNDVVDARADAVNRPGRPVPSGTVGRRAALSVAVLGYAAAIALGFAVGPAAGGLALAWVVVTALYSLALKGTPIVGNVTVAAVAASPLLMGGLSQRAAGPTLVPCALAFLAHLAREIVKDVEDMAGDRAAGVRTTAVALGAESALGMVRVVVVLLMGAAVVPFAVGLFGWGYAALVVVIDALLVVVLGAAGRGAEAASLRRGSLLLKTVMVVGLLAFALGVLGRSPGEGA